LPILVTPNLQLDLVEDLALGKEWQLGYWKHPPLPWWLADALYRATGDLDAIYLLGPLAAVVCFYGVWLLAREMVGAFEALIAVLVLEGIHFYNFSVVKFAHDQMQLPFWAFTALFFHRALARGRMLEWALAGALLAGAFWAKYAAFALAATLGLFLLIDPTARKTWRTPGPYVMAAAFLMVIAPNAWWLVTHDFMPFHYVDDRAREAAHWYQWLVYPLQWTGSQLQFLAPAIALLALLYSPADLSGLAAVRSLLPLPRGERAGVTGSRSVISAPSPPHPNPLPGGEREQAVPACTTAFDRRYVTALALGPFAITTIIFAVLGRLPVAMWGYPLWSFVPLALLMWLPPSREPRRLRWFAAGFLVVFFGLPLIYAAVELGEPFVRDRPKATQFPGEVMAEIITREWRDAYGTPLIYAGGTEFAVNNLAVYSPDHPHVVVHGDPKLSPWIDMADLHRRGGVLVWEEDHPGAHLEEWRAAFGEFEVQPLLVLSRQTLRPVKPAHILYALIPPRPLAARMSPAKSE
jgi:4-amino-4-deoxy-L-arabinose transferase-like glycosyltransferase